MADYTKQLNTAFAHDQALEQYRRERIGAEIEFAEQLCEQHPRQAKAWQKLIAEATDLVTAANGKSAAQFARAVKDAEAVMAPLGAAAKDYTMYVVGHAHIDMNWQWSWPETVAVTNDTFTTILKLMDEFPQFRFSQSQASCYRILEQHAPELLGRIAERVKEGRWEVTASHWVEGDKNIAGAESLCRHLLYTRRYMQELFGLSPEDVPIDWAPDTFGHAHTVPTYLVRGGVKYVYLHRPGAIGPTRPGAFRWRGPDGSEVLVRNDMGLGYNGIITPGITKHLMAFVKETGVPFFMFMYGIGDHGGGPTRRDIVRALDMDTWPVYPNVTMATTRMFYDRLANEAKNLPVLDCELNFEFTGCYTTETLIKKANRYGEKKLADAEAAATLAWARGAREYPAADFVEGWRDVLFSHFHDILPGSGVHDTRTYTHGLYQKTMGATTAAETNALRAVAAQIDTSSAVPDEPQDLPPALLSRALGAGVGNNTGNGGLSTAEMDIGQNNRPLVVFNPTAHQRAEVVEAMIWDTGWGWEQKDPAQQPYAVTGPDGKTVGAQVLDTGNYWGHQFVKLAFPATVGPFGYALYVVREDEPADRPGAAGQMGYGFHCRYSRYERSPEGIQNEFLQLDLDPTSGGIQCLTDKQTGDVIICNEEPAALLEYAVERPHGMTAWAVDHAGPVEMPLCRNVRRGPAGPYKATLEVDFEIHQSNFTVAYELRTGDPKLYISIKGTWFERGTRQTGVPVLNLALPFAFDEPQARYEIPFGAIDRNLQHGEEVPALRWAQVAAGAGKKQLGCVVYNDSKHGHSLVGSTLRVTLIRSSYDPDHLPEIGDHEINFALQPFFGEMPVADAIRTAMAFEQELRIVSTNAHAGDLPPAAALIKAQPAGVVCSMLKKAEDEDALILRFYDPTGRKTTAKATLDAGFFGKITKVVEVDLLEEPVATSTAKRKGNTVSVSLPSRGIATVKVVLQR